MREEEGIKKYGKENWDGMMPLMRGNTVGINDDGSTEYYDYDLERVFLELKGRNITKFGVWD